MIVGVIYRTTCISQLSYVEVTVVGIIEDLIKGYASDGIGPRSYVVLLNHHSKILSSVFWGIFRRKFSHVMRDVNGSEIIEEFDSVFSTRFGNPHRSIKSVNQGDLMFPLTKR